LNLKISKKEWVLVAMVAVIAVIANLPEPMLQGWGLSVHYLLITLAAVVFIALLLYLRFTFFLIVTLLVIGANLPGQLSSALNISKVPLILALALMVGISLINHIVRLLPSGLEKDSSKEAQKALFYAVEKGNMVYAQKLLNMNLDPNVKGPGGYTPLMYSAAKGHAGLAELFLRNGADTTLVNDEGDSAVDLALRFGHSNVADVLKQARMQQMAQKSSRPSEQGAFANAA
jgi:ankyrin repeat protein